MDSYSVPNDEYNAPNADYNSPASSGYNSPNEAPAAYISNNVPTYVGQGSDDIPVYAEVMDDDMLSANIPGVPGQDYPIYYQLPDLAFSCQGQVDGGKIEL